MPTAKNLTFAVFVLSQAAQADRRPGPDQEVQVALVMLLVLFVILSIALAVVAAVAAWGCSWPERRKVVKAGYLGALLPAVVLGLPFHGLYDTVNDTLISHGWTIATLSLLSAVAMAVYLRTRPG